MSYPKRCGLYVRVSTSDQNCDLQIQELTEYVSRRGWTVHKVYQDKASGANPNRKMLGALMQDCRFHHIDIVLTWKLDRLFRSLKNMVATLDEITGYGVEFMSVSDGIDLSKDSPSSRLMLHLISAFSEFELNLIRSRVVAGLQAAKARGQRLGRPPVISEKIRAEVHKLKHNGMSVRNIAQQVGIAKSTVQRLLEECTDIPFQTDLKNSNDSKG